GVTRLAGNQDQPGPFAAQLRPDGVQLRVRRRARRRPPVQLLQDRLLSLGQPVAGELPLRDQRRDLFLTGGVLVRVVPAVRHRTVWLRVRKYTCTAPGRHPEESANLEVASRRRIDRAPRAQWTLSGVDCELLAQRERR